MNNRQILRLVSLVKSCTNNLNKKYNGKFIDQVNNVCTEFCNENNIKITHGTAYKELRHKCYYYINKNIMSIITTAEDIYKLRYNKFIEDKQIVDKLINVGGINNVI